MISSLFFLSTVAPAAVVTDSVTIYPTVFPSGCWFISENVGSAGFSLMPGSLPGRFVVDQWYLADPFAYFVTPQGTAFTPEYISSHTPLVVNSGFSSFGNEIIIQNFGSILLSYWREPYLQDSPSIFGWVRIRNIGGNLSVLSSAATDASGGIYSGTLQAIPEPSSLAILILACPLITMRKKRTTRDA
jgi:hypothetical protein